MRVLPVPESSCEDIFRLVEPQINAEGVHVWPFDAAFPVNVLYLTKSARNSVRMNRHKYFEITCVCSGNGDYHIQDRLLPFREGDLAVVGSTLYHRIESRSGPMTLATLFFEPDLIRSDGSHDGAEYLTPFLLQDSDFPHIVPGENGIPDQVLDLMRRIRGELPARTALARLTVRTYLKMALVLLVNHYSSYSGTIQTFQRQQLALDRLRPLFEFIALNYGGSIQVREAARICGMSDSHFMSFFKQVTGQSFVRYLNHYRIERAQLLLTTTDETMVSISQKVGFCDQSYFGTVFLKLQGVTPAAYRRCHRFNRETGAAEVIQSASEPMLRRAAAPQPAASL